MSMVSLQATILYSTIAINHKGIDWDLIGAEKHFKLALDYFEIPSGRNFIEKNVQQYRVRFS